MMNLFPSSDVFVINQPLDSGFYDLEMPDAFRWMKQEAKCLLPSEKILNFSQPVLMITANTTNANDKPSLSAYINGVLAGTHIIDRYGSYYFFLKSSELNFEETIEISLKVDRIEKNGDDPRIFALPIYKIDFIDLNGGWEGFEERQYLAGQIKIFTNKESLLPSVLSNLQLTSNSMILDVGAGMGWTTALLAGTTGSKVFAIDMHKYDSFTGLSFKSEILSRFKRHIPVLLKEPGFNKFQQLDQVIDNCTFLTMDAQQLLFKDCLFDFIFSLNALEHIPDPVKALNEIYRVLKPGGQALLQFQPLYFSDAGHHLFDLTDIPWIHLLYRRSEIKKMILESGKPPNEVDNILNSLNGFTLKQYLDMFSNSQFKIIKKEIIRGFCAPDAEFSEELKKLRNIHPEEELKTKGLTILIEKGKNI